MKPSPEIFQVLAGVLFKFASPCHVTYPLQIHFRESILFKGLKGFLCGSLRFRAVRSILLCYLLMLWLPLVGYQSTTWDARHSCVRPIKALMTDMLLREANDEGISHIDTLRSISTWASLITAVTSLRAMAS